MWSYFMVGTAGITIGMVALDWVTAPARRRERSTYLSKIERLEENVSLQERNADYWRTQCYEQQHMNSRLEIEIRELQKAPKIREEICEAIKFAMTNAHPDKPNGNSEKFIKFHNLYKKYCK